MADILYGVCGIGHGHAHRQIPVVRALAADHRVVLLTYGDAVETFRREAEHLPNLTVLQVCVPRLPGGPKGLDWAAASAKATGPDPWEINGRTLARVEELIGTPGLVITDYEPVSASYAYATGAPLVTFDQQSKFLAGDLPRTGIDGQFGPEDEIARLRMFFPKAALRLACSFFPVGRLAVPHEEVEIIAPVLRDEILGLKRSLSPQRKVLVYLSPETPGGGDPGTAIAAVSGQPDTEFHIYCRTAPTGTPVPENVVLHGRGDGAFMGLLSSVHGLICTSGHSLLSEAVHLGIPVMTLPLELHEQQLNATRMALSGGSLMADALDAEAVDLFLFMLPRLAAATAAGTGLLRGTSAQPVLDRLAPWLAPHAEPASAPGRKT